MTDLQDAGRHIYRLPDGSRCHNVTSVTNWVDAGKAAAFAGAAAKLTREGLDHRKEWRRKAERGQQIHSYFEQWLQGKAIMAPQDDFGYLDALDQAMNDHDLTPVHVEQVVLSHSLYGGRFDLMTADTIVDLKTGKPYAMEHTLQLNAYNFADGFARYSEEGTIIDLLPFQPRERAAGLYVHEDGTYEWVEYPLDEEWHDLFLLMLGAKDLYEELEGKTKEKK